MTRLRELVDRALSASLVVLMTVMVGNVLWQIFTRYVLRHPSSYTEELARFLLVWVGLLGAAYALGRGMHLAIDLLPRPDGPLTRLTDTVSTVAVALFALAVMGVGGWNLVRLTLLLEQTSAALRLPLAWVYLVLPTSGVLIGFYALASIVERHQAQSRPRD